MRYKLKVATLTIALGLGLACIPGCHTGEESEKPRVATVQNGPSTIPAASPDQPVASPSADVQTLQNNANRDQQTLNEANRAVGVLGGR